ncbi:metallophosphoesterase family protein [Streptomyces sp. NBC_01262]|uniref:metallophosphoesterase family protein n=1 Tax=Streptomyces sp. NBC_01262 TaxID=2903803 RepID=UPI002E310449|nr:metallophosphoesterase family protein [Streptomyces sp. NBC_01262]
MTGVGTTFYGPASWEGPPRRHGPVARVAALSDVHGNIPALEAVLAEPDVAGADLIVLCGDLTWGPEPQQTYERIAALGERALCVRGNGDRYTMEIAAGTTAPAAPRQSWIPAQHSPDAMAFLARVPFSLLVEVHGLGPVLFCHGSPRSDHELVTPATPSARFAELAGSLDAPTLVTGHTHLQFDRAVAGHRSVGPGSVGLPYHHGQPGTAYWALLGPGIQLRSTRYDVSAAITRAQGTGDPGADTFVATLLRPPTPEEIIEDAETRVFAN